MQLIQHLNDNTCLNYLFAITFQCARLGSFGVSTLQTLWWWISKCTCIITGFPPYLENLENLEFYYFLFQAWQKVVNTWNFNSKSLKKTWNLQILCFKFSLFKMSFIKIILIYIFVLFTLSPQTFWFEAKLTLDFIAFTWK